MSRVNFGAKPNMYPLPVLIIATYDKDGNPDAMNAAWGVVTDFNEISISMGDHKTTDNLAATGAFTVSMATEDTVVGCDYVGIESGRKVPDKFARAGFHATKSEFVNAPLIDELPMALECKVKSFDNGILAVSVSFGGFCFITGMGVFMLGISILCAVFGVYFAKWMGRLFVWCTRKVTKKGGSRS